MAMPAEWEDLLKQTREIVEKLAPDAVITEIDFEGPLIVIYTKSIEKFAENPEIVRKLALSIRRRVSVRPDPSLLLPEEEAIEEIKKIVPEDAGIKHIYFEHDTGEVVIEADAPGKVIGKEGMLLNEIKRRIKWAPRVVRAPPIPSRIVQQVREFLKNVKDERRQFLRELGRKLNRPPMQGENWVRVTALGGYREVGRSAHLLQTRNSRILVDCGMGMSGENVTPYVNVPELWDYSDSARPFKYLDAVVLTHAHLDHCGFIPVLYKYNYEGPVYATAPTRDLAAMLLLDMIRVSYSEGGDAPFESKHVKEFLKRTITLSYGETTSITPDVRLTFHNAGHILGSAVAHFHIGDGLYNVVFTGDIKYEHTWLFSAAVNRFPRVEAVVMESTYGGRDDYQPSRKEAAETLKNVVRTTVERRGRVLIPVFAVGRSQEVMIVLENAMKRGEVPEVPIYLDGMIWEATAIHAAYPEFLNKELRELIFHRNENPFLSEIFQRVGSGEDRQKIIETPDPAVILATSGMMNGGPVIEYLKNMADDPKSTLVFVGYQAEGTLGRRIQSGVREITLYEKGMPITIKMEMEIVTIDGFSGHSDRRQLIQYISSMQPRPERVIVSHGEERKCLDLAYAINRRYGIETVAPRCLETVRLR